MRVFVTVGSTRFDKLVNAASSSSFRNLLHSLNYTHLIIQHGQSSIPPETVSEPGHSASVQLSTFKYKPTLREDMEQADLIISHAGSGSILEALRLKKKLIVVVNEDLMDNHQLELGSALHQQGHLVCCSASDLETTLRNKGYESLVPFPDPEKTRFANFLDSRIGL